MTHWYTSSPLATTIAVSVVLAGACSPDTAAPPVEAGADVAAASDDSSAAPRDAVWRDLVVRHADAERVAPLAFRASSPELRVIVRMEELISPYTPGLVVANLLSDRSALPIASVRAEQLRTDTVIADTTEVQVEPGELYLFIAEHRGLQDWTVTVQESHLQR